MKQIKNKQTNNTTNRKMFMGFKEDMNKHQNEFKQVKCMLLNKFQLNISKELNEIIKSIQDTKIEFNKIVEILR